MKVYLYQIQYDKKSRCCPDDDMIPYDNSAASRQLSVLENEREWRVFKNVHDAKWHLDSEYLGLLSWKLKKKTGLSGKDIKSLIEQDEYNHDVYFINCGPEVSSVWSQGERCHSGIVQLVRDIFTSLKYNTTILDCVHDKGITSFCNYWIGNTLFWNKYIEFTTPVYNYIQSNLTDEQYELLHTRADSGINANYFPFIMERLFTTLLYYNSDIKYKKIAINK